MDGAIVKVQLDKMVRYMPSYRCQIGKKREKREKVKHSESESDGSVQ